MKALAIVIVVIIVIAIVAALAVPTLRARQRNRLQQRFGPEYGRRVEEVGDRKKAEQQLADVAQRRDELDIKDLSADQRASFTRDWEAVQVRFVDEPTAALDSADTLLAEVMRARGYPVENFEERADLVAADHPNVVEHYRAAHQAHERHRSSGEVETEDLRQAFVHYRALFDALLGRDERRATQPTRPESQREARP